MRAVWRHLLLAVGLLALGLGAAGLFVPVLPTTPFVLLAAACFMRSSERLYAWVVGHRVFGPPVRDFLAGRGLTRRTKAVAVGTLWASVLLSAHLAVHQPALDVLLYVVAAGVTLFLLRLPTRTAGDARTCQAEDGA